MQLDENDINAQVKEIENLPELQSAFNEIEKIKDNVSEAQPDEEEVIIDENSGNDVEIDDNPTEEGGEQEIPVEAKKTKRGDKYRKLQNDKYRALAEKEEAQERVRQLEVMLEESLNSGTYHYSKNAYAELDRAKEAKQRAIEEGDSKAFIDADIDLVKAVHAVNELEQWAHQSEVNKHNSYDENARYKAVHEAMAKDWLDNHPYLKPNSRSYNPDLASQVTEFINHLDTDLYDKNESHLIFSEEYFDTIDDYISAVRTPKRDNKRHIESFSHVGRVRNAPSVHEENTSSVTKMTLTKDEKRMAENAGIPLKEWLRYKIEDSRTVRSR